MFEWSEGASRFKNALCLASRGRCFFINTERYMGLAPQATQPGDRICILYGRRTPYIQRPHPNKSTYRLIGDAYVHGIMDGEAFELRDKYSLPDKTFIIE